MLRMLKTGRKGQKSQIMEALAKSKSDMLVRSLNMGANFKSQIQKCKAF
jgi:hypothetical protein